MIEYAILITVAVLLAIIVWNMITISFAKPEYIELSDWEGAEVEHEHLAMRLLSPKLWDTFPDGACVVWADETFTAAIPATMDETEQLADLMEVVAIDGDGTKYNELRARLCRDKDYRVTSLLFKTEMEKLRRQDSLASAARRNN